MIKYLIFILLCFSTTSFAENFKCYMNLSGKKFEIQLNGDSVLFNKDEYKPTGMHKLIPDHMTYMYYNKDKKYYLSLTPNDNSYDFVIIYGDSEKDKWEGGYCFKK